jgi:hypothetical protein
MMRLSSDQRAAVEARIRAAAQQLLAWEIPVGGRCDITTLARIAGISRAALCRTHRALKDEFEDAIGQRRDAGEEPRSARGADREAQTDR